MFRSRFGWCPEDQVARRVKMDCNDPACPNCADPWLNRQAEAMLDKLREAGDGHQAGPLRHFTLSLDPTRAKRMLREVGKGGTLAAARYVAEELMEIKGGVLVLHPWRGKDGTWELSPHVHLFGFGYAKPSAKVYGATGGREQGGWVYKRIRDVQDQRNRSGVRNEAFRTIRYILSHAPLIYPRGGGQRRCSWSWAGIAGIKGLRRDGTESDYDALRCPLCGEAMLEYFGEPGGSCTTNNEVAWVRRKRTRWRPIPQVTQTHVEA